MRFASVFSLLRRLFQNQLLVSTNYWNYFSSAPANHASAPLALPLAPTVGDFANGRPVYGSPSQSRGIIDEVELRNEKLRPILGWRLAVSGEKPAHGGIASPNGQRKSNSPGTAELQNSEFQSVSASEGTTYKTCAKIRAWAGQCLCVTTDEHRASGKE